MREMCRFASVPAGCPEPYLYGRLFSGSEIAVGVEAASANRSQANHLTYYFGIVARNVSQVNVSGTKHLSQLRLVTASLQFVDERSELLVIEFYPC